MLNGTKKNQFILTNGILRNIKRMILFKTIFEDFSQYLKLLKKSKRKINLRQILENYY